MEGTVSTSHPASLLFFDLRARAHALLREFRSYQTHLQLHKKQRAVEVRAFKRGVESEVKTLERLSHNFVPSAVPVHNPDGSQNELEEDLPHVHALRSSNLPFYEAVWNVAKSCHGVSALSKKMYFGTVGGLAADDGRADKRAVVVDVVANNGLDWIKVSTVTEKRLLFEMAKEGWERYGGSSDEDEDGGGQPSFSHDGKLELVRLAEDLRTAAHVTRIQFRHPQIHFVLPYIREGVFEDFDTLLADLRSTGALVKCGDRAGKSLVSPRLDLDLLMPTTTTSLVTSTINVDCTILLALVSDISHLSRQQLSSLPSSNAHGYHKAIMNQIEAEATEPMLPGELYPVLAGRRLECTSHAAQRMREIIDVMATATERIRADIVLGEGKFQDQAVQVLRMAFDENSLHHVPDDLLLPIKVVDVSVQELLATEINSTRDPMSVKAFPESVAARALGILTLSPVNVSVFLYGWIRHMTTLTSNRTVASGLIKAINQVLDLIEREGAAPGQTDFVAPLIYTCETARSLVGKAKSTERDDGRGW